MRKFQLYSFHLFLLHFYFIRNLISTENMTILLILYNNNIIIILTVLITIILIIIIILISYYLISFLIIGAITKRLNPSFVIK